MTKEEASPSRTRARLRRAFAIVKRIAIRFWAAVNVTRRALVNLLLIATVLIAIVFAASDDSPDFADRTAIVLTPKGTLVEEKTAFDPATLVRGGGGDETLLRDVIETIEFARTDDRITAMVLDLSHLNGGGLSKLQEIATSIQSFRADGKTVVATADAYSQAGYFLAAHADEVYVHHMGAVALEGYGRYQMYFADALARLEVDFNIFRVGKYKSAVEPYLRDDMSEAARAANLEWMGDLWTAYLTDVATARGLEVQALRDYANHYDRYIADANGSGADAAVTAGLVDHAVARDAVVKRLIELVGEDTETHLFHQLAGAEYLAHMRDEHEGEDSGRDAVAVIVARGSIVDGEQASGSIGGDSTAALVRQARHDDTVKAIVLRVDSGGGSAFASEIIRREFELAREAGKPVVISMGSVAASGGYWISTASDEIWASPTTITGSIGIFGMFPTFQRPLATHLGIHVDGVATGPLAGVRSDRALDADIGRAIQRQIERGYADFLQRVADARGMTTEEVDVIAQGRVWSGEDAHAHGLVDELGGLSQAIASAAAKANLGEDYRVDYVSKKLGFKDELLRDLTSSAEVQHAVRALAGEGLVYAPLVRFLEEQLLIVDAFNDPHNTYAYAFLDVD